MTRAALRFAALTSLLLADHAQAEQGGLLVGTVAGRGAAGARIVDGRTGIMAPVGPDGAYALGPLAPGIRTLFLLRAEGAPVRIPGIRIGAGGRSLLDLRTDPPRPLAFRPEGPEAAAIKLPSRFPGARWVELPDGPLPVEIRVGRRFASSCRDAEVQRIDSLDLEEYVKGVVRAEVGVFKGVEGRVEAAFETWAGFAIAARSYALWFYLRAPDGDYHLDDTACNQVYKDERDADVDRAVESTRGLVMVAASDLRTVDKFEYAASCGRHGSLPEHAEGTVPDDTGGHACVGSWCGHDRCAGHQVNPAFPEEGRCLVRGICQWGSVERSQRGDTWQEILAHYQPHLEVIEPGGGPDPLEPGTLVGFVRTGDEASGDPIAGATVGIDVEGGPQAVTDSEGFYRLEDLQPGIFPVSATAEGHLPATAEVDVSPGVTEWRSFGLEPAEVAVDAGFPPDVVADVRPLLPAPDPDTSTGPDGASLPPGSAGEVPGDLGGDRRRGSIGCDCRLGRGAAIPWALLRRR